MKYLTVIVSKSPPDVDKPLGKGKYVAIKIEDDALLQQGVVELLSKGIINQLDLYENRK